MDNSSSYNSDIYDEKITSVLPYYREYHTQVIDLVRNMGINSPEWLDTGCGTGTLALRALSEMPGIRFTLADPSENMLDEAKAKLDGRDIRYVNAPSDKLPFIAEFDIITAIQSHHYYDINGRKQAVKRCFDALKKGGVFVTFENIRMSSDISDAIAVTRWKTYQKEHGRSPEDVEAHIARRGTVMFPITIEEHLDMLKKCGFATVDILWTSYLQAGFWAVK